MTLDDHYSLSLTPGIDGFDPRDDVVLTEVDSLRRELRDSEAELVPAPRGDGKSGELAVQVIEVVVGGGAGMTGILLLLRDWVRRRGKRSVDIVVRRGGKKAEITVNGDNVSEETLFKALRETLDDT